jgi:hypothetical protein
MNEGTCYSQQGMDQLLMICGIIGGIFLLCCFVGIFWAVRSSHIKEREAEKAKNRLSLGLSSPYTSTQLPSTAHRAMPISYSNPVPMGLMSPVNMINSTANISRETSVTQQSSDYNQCMKYLAKTDQLLQKEQPNNHSEV